MKTGFFLDGRGLCDVEIVSRGTIVSPHLYIYYKVCAGDGVSGWNCRAGWATGWMGVEQDVFLIII